MLPPPFDNRCNLETAILLDPAHRPHTRLIHRLKFDPGLSIEKSLHVATFRKHDLSANRRRFRPFRLSATSATSNQGGHEDKRKHPASPIQSHEWLSLRGTRRENGETIAN